MKKDSKGRVPSNCQNTHEVKALNSKNKKTSQNKDPKDRLETREKDLSRGPASNGLGPQKETVEEGGLTELVREHFQELKKDTSLQAEREQRGHKEEH